MQTELYLNRGGFPPFSARGCQQILQPLVTGELRRTVNGELMYTGTKQHHKYKSIILCQDQSAPALEGIWRGQEVTVGCIQRLCQEFTIGEQQFVDLERSAVQGSLAILNEKNELIQATMVTSQRIQFSDDATTQKVFVTYRPELKMRVLSFQLMTNEWNLNCGWRLELEEI